MENIFIYLIMFIGTLVFIYRAQINTRRFDTLDSNINFYVSILFFAIIVGLRWDVGIDYMAYYDLVVGNNQFETELTRLELIPRGMIIFFRNFNIPFYFWFILMAYIQLFFILKAFSKELKKFACWGAFFYLVTYIGFSMNVIRQAAALSIVLYSYTFLNKNEIKKFILCILLASLFHISAIISLLVYFIRYIRIPQKIGIQFIILIVTFFCGDYIVNLLADYFLNFSDKISYLNKIEKIVNKSQLIVSGTNIGILYYYLRFIVLMLYSNKLSISYNKYGFNCFYNISFIGMMFYKAFMYDIYLSRILMFFTIASVPSFAIMMHYFSRKSIKSLEFLLMIIFVISEIILFGYTYIDIPWNFVWNV